MKPRVGIAGLADRFYRLSAMTAGRDVEAGRMTGGGFTGTELSARIGALASAVRDFRTENSPVHFQDLRLVVDDQNAICRGFAMPAINRRVHDVGPGTEGDGDTHWARRSPSARRTGLP